MTAPLVGAIRRGAVTALVPADPANSLPPMVTVALGGDTVNLVTLRYLPTYGPVVGDDITVLSTTGSAAGAMVVLGTTSPDQWHTVGDAGEPIFGGTWQNIAGTRKVGFRRNGDRVELCGAAGTSGTATAPTTVYTLPTGYRPDFLLRYTLSFNNVGGATNTAATILINTTGAVQLTHFTGTITIGSVGFEGLSFPLIGAV